MNFYSNNVAWKNDVNSKLMITTKVDMPKKNTQTNRGVMKLQLDC